MRAEVFDVVLSRFDLRLRLLLRQPRLVRELIPLTFVLPPITTAEMSPQGMERSQGAALLPPALRDEHLGDREEDQPVIAARIRWHCTAGSRRNRSARR
jgi:hypothetical protein